MNQSIDKLLWIIGISGLGAALSECAVLSSIKNGTTDSIAFGVFAFAGIVSASIFVTSGFLSMTGTYEAQNQTTEGEDAE